MAKRQNKRFQSSSYARQLTGDAWFGYYQRTLQSLVLQLFEWKNLPETIDPMYIERVLHFKGDGAFYKDKLLGEMFVSGTPIGLNAYGRPVYYRVNMIKHHKQIPLYTYLETNSTNTVMMNEIDSEEKGIYLTNQLIGNYSSWDAIQLFSALLTENKQTKLINQTHLKTPYIFRVQDQNTKLSLENMFDKVQSNEPAIYVDKDFNFGTDDGQYIFNLNAPYNLDKLEMDRSEIFNEFLTHFGIDNVNINKRERLVTSEADSNNEMILHNRNKFLAPRKEVCRILSNLWDREITVDLRENVNQIADKVGKNVTPDNHDIPEPNEVR